MAEKWVESPRGRTHYWISGKPGAPALVFLHPLAADHTLFDRQAEYFAEEYAVLAWDAPGHGASRPYADFSMLHCAVELKRILDAERIDRCVLVGQSLGGMIAQTFIAHWPERVRGFVGVGTWPMAAEFYRKADLRFLRRAHGLARLYPFKALHRALSRRAGRTLRARAVLRVAEEVFSRRELSELVRAVSAAALRELDAGLPACPTLLLVGEKDRADGVRARCAAWRDRFGLPLYRVRAAGRCAAADNPRSANRLIHAFLNSLPLELRR